MLLPAIGTTFPPGVAGNTLQPSPVIDGHQELWWETAQGVQGTRIDGTTGDWVGTEIPAPGSYADPDWTQLPASATLRFADLQGPSTPVIVGRSTGGLTEIAHTSGSWARLPDLDALSDADGFNAEQYWRTITYADVDGDEQAELLVRGPEGVDIWKLEADGWQRLPGSIGLADDPSGKLSLADDPWGGDQSYYGTFRAGDVDGDGHDELIARGPYGIRTWFYNRPGQPGFGPYRPTGSYPSFTSTSGQRAAYAQLNATAKSNGVLRGNQTSIRAVWTDPSTADTDLDTLSDSLRGLDDDLAGPLVGNCGAPLHVNPPRYAACTPVVSPSEITYTAEDWTNVVNELAAEVYDAQQVVAFYTTVDDIRQKLFLGQSTELPAIGSQIDLAGAATAQGAFSMNALVSGLIGIASSIAGEFADPTDPGANPGTALSITSYIMSMIPSASPAFAANTFATTYSQLQGKFATAVTQADAALESLNFQVRSDRNLMGLVSQLSLPGAPWDRSSLDSVGMESAGNQAFTLWVYKSLLPSAYGRYSITRCWTPAFGTGYNDGTVRAASINSCSVPAASAWAIPGSPINNNGTVVNSSMQDVEPLPSGTDLHSTSPCHLDHDALSFPMDCAFSGPDPGVMSAVSGLVTNSCIHQPEIPNTTWSFGCSLGIDADAILNPPAVLNSAKETWNFQSRTGSPVAWALSGTSAVAAGAARAGNAARRHTVRLAGKFRSGRRPGLRHATVAIDRVLSVPDGDHELVARRAPTRLGSGRRTRRLGSIKLRQTSRGRFRSREQGRKAPRITAKLTLRERRSLAFSLTVANVAIPRLSDVCGHGLAALRVTPEPFVLSFRMRILRPHRAPLAISTMEHFACRYARSGAVRGLRIVQPSRPAKPGRSLTLKVRHPRRLTVGRRATLTATVRNETSRRAQDVYTYVVLPHGLRVVGSNPDARVKSRQVAWRFSGLRRHRTRTVRLHVVPTRSGPAARCSVIHVRAMLRRSARTRTCIHLR
ncbi:MAG: FG-GAP repeat domain-containing protein [Solirubrobacteraceae bacterium]